MRQVQNDEWQEVPSIAAPNFSLNTNEHLQKRTR